jgi:hypothetical protein
MATSLLGFVFSAAVNKWRSNQNRGNGGLNQILETKDNPPEVQINLFLTNSGWVDKL